MQMQCLRYHYHHQHSLNLIRRPPPSSFSLNLFRPPPPKRLIRFSSLQNTAMSTVEHVVLFKVRDNTDQSKIDSMLGGLNALAALDAVLHLSAAPLLRTRSPISLFTHILHSRYTSKDGLAAYSAHPDHLRVVNDFVKPICDDIMAVDWVADRDPEPPAAPPGSAARVTLLKLKEGATEEVKGEVLGVIKGIREGIPAIQQLTCGENFSPARGKGFSIASIAVFPSAAEMDANGDFVVTQKEKVRDCLDGVIVVDFLLPPSSSSSSL